MQMTRRERWLAALDGRPADRLVFWPKIFNRSYMASQAAPFDRMSIREIHDYAGTDIQIYLPKWITLRHSRCTYIEDFRDNVLTKVYSTPMGRMKSVLRYDPVSDSDHPEVLPIRDLEDIRAMTLFFEDIEPVVDEEKLALACAAREELGDRGIAVDNIGESPLMDFVEWYAGIENGHYLLEDYPDELAELFAAMQRINVRLTELKCQHSPADVLYFTENTSTTIISPDQFRQYCVGHLREYAEICKTHDRRLIFHMCGHLMKVLPDIAALDFTGIEALSAPPIGNTTFADARAVLPGRCLIGGTNCLTWIKSPGEIIAELEGYLAELKDYRGIVVGTGGIIPPACVPETIREVCSYLYQLPMK